MVVRRLLVTPLRLADALLVISRAALNALTEVDEALRAKAHLVYNGVPEPPEAPVPAARDESMRLVMVGRLSPRKAPHLALEAVAALRREGYDLTLEVAGSVYPGYEWYEDGAPRAGGPARPGRGGHVPGLLQAHLAAPRRGGHRRAALPARAVRQRGGRGPAVVASRGGHVGPRAPREHRRRADGPAGAARRRRRDDRGDPSPRRRPRACRSTSRNGRASTPWPTSPRPATGARSSRCWPTWRRATDAVRAARREPLAVGRARRPDLPPTRPTSAEVLPALAEQALAQDEPYAVGVLVVDNDPAAGARDAVESFAPRSAGVSVRYVHEPQPGISAARNRALAEAASRLLVFIDDDERPSPTGCRCCSRPFATRPACRGRGTGGQHVRRGAGHLGPGRRLLRRVDGSPTGHAGRGRRHQQPAARPRRRCGGSGCGSTRRTASAAARTCSSPAQLASPGRADRLVRRGRRHRRRARRTACRAGSCSSAR